MRDIKFRGISVKTGKMVYGGGIDSQRDTPAIINHGERHFVDAKTVGEYTGRKDKNGTEAYEGDWVKPANGNYVTGCIVWWRGAFWVSGKNKRRSSGRDLLVNYPEFTIEANIHQNPELVGK